MRRHWWVRGSFFCCYAATENGVVVDTAPILRKFIGQPATNLTNWQHYIEHKEIFP